MSLVAACISRCYFLRQENSGKSARIRGRTAKKELELVRNVVERILQTAANKGDSRNNSNSDTGGDKAVFDGGGTRGVLPKAGRETFKLRHHLPTLHDYLRFAPEA